MSVQYIEAAAITHASAHRILAIAVEEGSRMGVKVAVTIVDPMLALVGYLRADGITPHSVETSRRKAQTAASTRRPTGWMSPELAAQLPAGSGGLLTNIKGGFPLTVDGRLIGGLGIAGGSPDQDAEIGLAVIARVGMEV